MEREKLFKWKDSSGTRTNMYKLAGREFKTGETFSLQELVTLRAVSSWNSLLNSSDKSRTIQLI